MPRKLGAAPPNPVYDLILALVLAVRGKIQGKKNAFNGSEENDHFTPVDRKSCMSFISLFATECAHRQADHMGQAWRDHFGSICLDHIKITAIPLWIKGCSSIQVLSRSTREAGNTRCCGLGF